MDTLTVCFKPACGALCILHESTVLYVSNPFVCPNAQRKHKHSADLLFVERLPRRPRLAAARVRRTDAHDRQRVLTKYVGKTKSLNVALWKSQTLLCTRFEVVLCLPQFSE